MNPSNSPQEYPLAFNTSWHVLGPFQIGTREATWGSDPLEFLGGFNVLHYDQKARFKSPLSVNGTARWSIVQAKQTTSTSTSANASLSISYPDVDWAFLKNIYGWAAVQYQAWARGEIVINGNETQHVTLYTDWILEYSIDDVHFFGGDFFNFRKAPPVLHLSPGTHKIELRLVRDVRALGGILEPAVDVVLELQHTCGTLELAKPGILMSDVVDGTLASTIASIALRNAGEDDIEIVHIQPSQLDSPASQEKEAQVILGQGSAFSSAKSVTNSFGSSKPFGVILVAGQTRPLTFNVSLPSHNASSVKYTITYKRVNREHSSSSLFVTQTLTRRSIHEPHKITYLHPGGMVSYAMLRPPNRNSTWQPEQRRLPVLLALHGAGLEADNDLVAHALDPVSDLCAWTLFPTGVTPWSSDDWHNWGFVDVEAAIEAIPSWIKTVNWKGAGVDTKRWVVSGHSNGGQGTWYALTHRADRIVAAAAVSGYASIQKYVPYELWQPADPRRTAIISASLNSYRHEMLLENAQGIPVLQQHGEKDDNVPVYHSRFLSQLLSQTGTGSSYYELPGRGHWFDTVMTTSNLVDFYRQQTASNDAVPRKLDKYKFVVADPGDTGSKGNVQVTHLEDPGQYGRVEVESHTIKTSNVLGLEIHFPLMGAIAIDDQVLNIQQLPTGANSPTILSKTAGTWKASITDIHLAFLNSLNHQIGPLQSTYGAETPIRRGRQLGGMTAILRTQGPFTIRHQGNETAHVALQVSRNLHQYFSADSNIVVARPSEKAGPGSANVISVYVGAVPPALYSRSPIEAGAYGISIQDDRGQMRTFDSDVGAAFLRPLDGERLELVLWGLNSKSLLQAARLLPMLTGVGQPDFAILGPSARWRGIEGVYALGFFNHEWNVTSSSLVE